MNWRARSARVEDFASLGGLFRSPYTGNQASVRVDVPFRRGHRVFARYTFDRNAAFTNVMMRSLPSGWSERINDSRLALAGMTTVVSKRTDNDMRISLFEVRTPARPATADTCPGCFGLGEVRTIVSGADLVYGGSGRLAGATARRVQLTDTLTWHLGRHTLRGGGEWEHNEAVVSNSGSRAIEVTLFTPRESRQALPDFTLPLPG